MTPLAQSPLEQHIRLDAMLDDGRLIASNLVTTRTGLVVQRVAGQPLADIPYLLSQLFPLCGMAHAAAALDAIEAALQIRISVAQQTCRRLLLLAEQAAALAWRLTMDWPALLGLAADTRSCANFRRAVTEAGAAIRCGRWMRIGGVTLRPDRDALAGRARVLVRMARDLFPEAAGPALSWNELKRNLESGASIAARLIRSARAGALADYGRHDLPVLPPLRAGWFKARLSAPGTFSQEPSVDGIAVEVGPLAAQRHPLIAAAIADWGPTLATRLLSGALDTAVVADRLADALDGLTDDAPAPANLSGTGTGAGVVDTTRGPLAYYVDLAAGEVQSLRSVAPTEWNFQPHGPFVAALRRAPRVADPLFAARLLAASFDPCVAFTIALADRPVPVLDAETVDA